MTAPGHVVVVGGGFAGLTAALRLARAGRRVTLLERRPFLGGRAYSFTHAPTGDVLDNGPHAFMGAYTALSALCRDVGVPDAIGFQPRLHVPMAHPIGGMGAVAAPPVPGPLQAPLALLRYGLVSRRDRVRLVAGAVRMVARRAGTLDGLTVADLLAAVGQSAAARRRFWDPLVIATLNEVPERAAAAPLVAVLRRGFLAGARAARFGFARGPLGDVFAAPVRAAIERAGGTVRTGAAVAALDLAGDRVCAVILRDGWRLAADAVVLAVPLSVALPLLPAALRGAQPFASLATASTSPIVSVHLWMPTEVEVGAPAAGAPFVGLLDTQAQWLFDCGPSASGGRRVATVTSGARAWDDADDRTIADAVLADVRRTLPALRDVACTRAHVVRERHATLSLTPAVERLRPGTTTAVPNLVLAGDWVQTGLPATIESAVVSGERAAAAADVALRSDPGARSALEERGRRDVARAIGGDRAFSSGAA
jgi:squalene-associated FAD-dependent desaturase